VEMHQVRHSTLVNASATYTFVFGTRISRIESVSEVDTWCAGMRHLQPGKSLRGAVGTISRDASFFGDSSATLHTCAAEETWIWASQSDVLLIVSSKEVLTYIMKGRNSGTFLKP
jgi:hypothetical protein